MLCTRNRWGQGTSNCLNVPTTEEAKKMDDKLKQMMAERAKQDIMWTNTQQEPAKKELK